MKKLTGIACALAVAFGAGLTGATAQAEDAKPFAGHESVAWQKLYEALHDHMSQEVASRLKLIAYHGVATKLCDGVEMDKAKVTTAMNDLHPENWDELSDEDHAEWNNLTLVSYGMISGVMLAEHADHADEFCAGVKEVMADKESEWNYFAAMAQ